MFPVATIYELLIADENETSDEKDTSFVRMFFAKTVDKSDPFEVNSPDIII